MDLGNGIAVALPAGWTIEKQAPGSVKIRNAAGVIVILNHGKANQTTAGEALAADAADILKQLTDPATSEPKVGAGTGPHFDQLAFEEFKGTLSGQSGTSELGGVFVEDFNSATRDSVFLAGLSGSPDDFKAAIPDIKSMIGSLG